MAVWSAARSDWPVTDRVQRKFHATPRYATFEDVVEVKVDRPFSYAKLPSSSHASVAFHRN
jgi:hypothetical protein